MDTDDVTLYAFSYYDEVRKSWVRARYKARREVIAERYQRWRIEGEAETRKGGGQFMPPSSS